MILTQEQLDEVDRIIKETVVVADWDHEAGSEEDSLEFDDGAATLVEAARRVREYLSTL